MRPLELSDHEQACPSPTFRVSALRTYPVKGCAGYALPEGMMSSAGLQHDRSFLVVSDEGSARTQREQPRLALIQPVLSADGSRLVLHAPGRDAVGIDVDTAGQRREVKLFGTDYRGIDQGHVVAGWLSETLGVGSRLVRVGFAGRAQPQVDRQGLRACPDGTIPAEYRGQWPPRAARRGQAATAPYRYCRIGLRETRGPVRRDDRRSRFRSEIRAGTTQNTCRVSPRPRRRCRIREQVRGYRDRHARGWRHADG